jgi:hypothetical protein
MVTSTTTAATKPRRLTQSVLGVGALVSGDGSGDKVRALELIIVDYFSL